MKPALYARRRFEGPAFGELDERFAVTVLDGPVREAALAGRIPHAAAIWTFGETIDAALLDALPVLAVVANHGVGTDTIDTDALARRKIALVVPRGVNAPAVASHAMALLLAVRHRVVEGDRMIRSGAWASRHADEPLGDDVSGSTLGIVGLGAIGQQLARRATAFDMPVLATSRTAQPAIEASLGVERVALAELLERSETVAICCPLTPATRGLIGAEELRRLGPRGVLVNVARGAIVDEAALVAALVDETILGAGLDVFVDEPRVPAALLAHPRVVVTPHTADYQAGMLETVTAAVVRGLLLVGSTG